MGRGNTPKDTLSWHCKTESGCHSQEGLKSMNRQYVHLSETTEDAIKVGKRHGDPVVLAINTQKVIDDGRDFYRVPKGIWLIERVMPEYLFVVI